METVSSQRDAPNRHEATGEKLQQAKLWLDIKKNFILPRVAEH